MSAAEPIAELRGVFARAGSDGTTIQDVNLSIARGAFVALLGAGGAGKSLILDLLAGLAVPDGGEVWLDGQPAAGVAAYRRGLGYMAATDPLFPHLSVAGNIEFPLRLRGFRRAERRERIARMLMLTKLSDLARQMPGQLKADTYRRALIARAAAIVPPLLLLDAPFSGLGRDHSAGLIEDVRTLQAELGCAVLLATRDTEAALTLAHHVCVLDRGRVLQQGSPRQLYDNPADATVAMLTGEMNVLPGRIETVREDFATVRLRAGPRVSARHNDSLQPGDSCLLAIRPERIALALADAVALGEDAIPAVIEDITYQGPTLRVRLIIGENALLSVVRPSAAATAGLARNRPAALAWQPAHAFVLPLTE